jgi:hypothetical protein
LELKIRLHIERMVLNGLAVDRAHGGRVRGALQAELARLLASGGVSPELRSGAVVPSLRGEKLRVAKGSAPAELGRNIAAAVYGGIGGPRRAGKTETKKVSRG